MRSRRGRCQIGTSGYQYDHWRGAFYPETLATRDWLAYYANHFETVEINSTFYRLPSAATVKAWRKAAGAGFCFALKFSRYGTHLKHLLDPQQPIAAFLDRAQQLGSSLGPILVQLPPRWAPNVERLGRFLEVAPRRLRWAFEFRDPRWLCEPVFRLLREQGAALCVHDLIAKHPREITTNWIYLRFHGDQYAGSYTQQFLTAEARRLEAYRARGLDVYVYFNNDLGGHAVRNALDLKRYVQNAAATRRSRPTRDA